MFDLQSDLVVETKVKKISNHWIRWALFAVIGLLLLILVPLAISASVIVGDAKAINQNANQAVADLLGGKIDLAKNNLSLAQKRIVSIKNSLRWIGPVQWLPVVKENLMAVDTLLSSVEKLLSGYGRVASVFSQLENKLNPEIVKSVLNNDERRIALLQLINDNKVTFLEAKKEIEEANVLIEKIDSAMLVGPLKAQIASVGFLLKQVVENTEIALPIVSNLPELVGYQKEKHYLFLFQNNLEIRPTGGFIGSYGLLTVKDGKITDLFTDDIYNLDKLSQGKLQATPPEPMQKYINQKTWYLRDANWSPDWSQSAEKILWFFNEERKNASLAPIALDGVIALTPEFIANLLSVIGPMYVNNVLFDDKNFAADLDQFVEFDYKNQGIGATQRKSIISDLSKKLLAEIYQMPSRDLLKIWLALKQNIDEKNILVYLTDKNLQQFFFDKNWSGVVKGYGGDYLMVVDSNMASLKTDQVITRDLQYSVMADKNGDLVAHIELTYYHNGQYLTDLITRYRNYVRVYVPSGTWFLKAYLQSAEGQKDLEILKDLEIGEDLGKKYAATFMVTEPGKWQKLVLEYRLAPELIKAYQNGKFDILVQKQPGTKHNLKINLNFGKLIQAYQADKSPSAFEGKTINWVDDLSMDKEYRLRF